VPLRVEITLPDGSVRNEYAVNISPGGVCLHVAQPLPDEVRLDLRLWLPPDAEEVRVAAHVVWSSWHEGDDGGERFWETGIHFDDLSAAMSEQILGYARQPKNRRR
jgi:hypothetical protein